MAIERKKLFKGVAWFFAVVVVMTLFMVFAQMMSSNSEFLKKDGINVILWAVSIYIVYDLIKKYKVDKKKGQMFGIVFFVLISLVYLLYFVGKII